MINNKKKKDDNTHIKKNKNTMNKQTKKENVAHTHTEKS
jgi:hypothetical protein